MLNAAKTKYILLRPRNTPDGRPLVVTGIDVHPSPHVKYLGLEIDAHLTFKPQIAALRRKIGAKLSTVYRIRTMLTPHVRRTFYLSFIQSTIEYASKSYVHCLHAAEHNVLIKISKRALRVVFCYPSRAHTLPILARQSLTPVATRFDVKLYTLVFRCTSGQTSPSPVTYSVCVLYPPPTAQHASLLHKYLMASSFPMFLAVSAYTHYHI